MRMKSKVTIQPTIEPVTLEEVKEHLRIDSNEEDPLINSYIEAARIIAEDSTGRKFISQTLVGYTDTLGGSIVHGEWWNGTREGTYFTHIANRKAVLELDWAPCISITQIDTIDGDNTENTYAATNYYLENYDDDMFPSVHLNENADIPTDLRDRNAVKVTYVAGYGTTRNSVPMSLRHSIKMMAATLYNKRGDCSDCAHEAGQVSLLNKYSIKTV